ncbi:MAG: Maf-like protein [Alphaproteobacteria bacterium]|nr:Maf-like protein [Alphaproteobacteria bacterium]
MSAAGPTPMTSNQPPNVVLASGSRPRARMLVNAGVPFTVNPSSVDENSAKASMRAAGADVADVAEMLAATKAQQVSRNHAGELVIGADQMLVCDGDWFDKPASLGEARNQLVSLRGKTHELISAVCVVCDGVVIWHRIERATITMRHFSDEFIDQYIAKMDEDILATVGGYELEGLGAQLFSRIEGDYFTILGMPLLPLLEFLRGHGVITE